MRMRMRGVWRVACGVGVGVGVWHVACGPIARTIGPESLTAQRIPRCSTDPSRHRSTARACTHDRSAACRMSRVACRAHDRIRASHCATQTRCSTDRLRHRVTVALLVRASMTEAPRVACCMSPDRAQDPMRASYCASQAQCSTGLAPASQRRCTTCTHTRDRSAACHHAFLHGVRRRQTVAWSRARQQRASPRIEKPLQLT